MPKELSARDSSLIMRYCGNLLLEQLLQTLSSFLGACLIAECGQTEEAVAVLAEACTRGANVVGILKQVVEEVR